MKIYKLTSVTDAVVNAFAKLIPQLAPDCTLPTKKDLEAIVNSGHAMIFMAEENDQILGTMTLVLNKIPTGDKVWIEDVVVDTSARGKGVGVKLIQYSIDYATTQMLKSINLTSSPDRVAANQLYQKLGFKQRETNVYRLTLK
ncbi:ribosomal protein S18 acetylase RimI-like enzyme [Gelidibacter sediminis]|uniref:Ribosomal protein S18 acetylase RimI-like enzyme n=1 Tax=Gelidibacter sediminis TaxID=1608710 RepID=A0A4R7Q654_9FLAO|nr:GNAT family N-acetyltransferase [Gelidibacter sediminis]TDU43024.1 ribosomal protein S18 acetylase RimI-like enzyme [Gelidibacter sediminis]